MPWGELTFPALVALGFETPTWFPASGLEPPAPRAGAGLTFYEGDQNCAVLYGGYDGPSGTAPRGDLALRCEGTWQLDVAGSGPGPRKNPAMAYAPFAGAQAGVYLFGGEGSNVPGNLWRLTLSGSPGGPRNATWASADPTAGPQPQARTEAGLAWTGAELLLFGGVAIPSQAMFTDTWAFNGTSWRLVCNGCFPERRAFAATVRGAGASREILAIGGLGELPLGGAGTAAEAVRFTGTGWEPVDDFDPAPDATLADGRLSPQGQSAPGPRDSSWAAGDPSGRVLVGSGIYDFFLPPDQDWNDVWRLDPEGTRARWARVPVSASLPGRRIGGSAVHDPVRGETLIVGGMALVERTNPPAITDNTSPPVAYRSQAGGVLMKVACRNPGPDGACGAYELAASVTLPADPAPSRARLVFLRQRGTEWVSAGPGCGSFDAPLAPAAGTSSFTCLAAASLGDVAFAAQAFDGDPPEPPAECAPGAGVAPIDDGIDAYAGTSVCRSLPAADGEVLVCD